MKKYIVGVYSEALGDWSEWNKEFDNEEDAERYEDELEKEVVEMLLYGGTEWYEFWKDAVWNRGKGTYIVGNNFEDEECNVDEESEMWLYAVSLPTELEAAKYIASKVVDYKIEEREEDE